MDELMSRQTKKIEICEVDYKNRYKIYNILSVFTELATENAAKIGLWNEETKGKYGWVIAKQTLTLDEPIHVDDVIEFSTIINNGSAAIFPRYYFIHKEGKEIGRCSAIWTLLDLKLRRIVFPKREGIQVPKVSHDIKLDTPNNINTDIPLEYKMERQVLYSDVDLNQHMNNARYIEWALDAIDINVHKDHFISEVTCHYKKEIMPLEYVDIYVGNDSLQYVIQGKNKNDEECFLIEIHFTKENNPTL